MSARKRKRPGRVDRSAPRTAAATRTIAAKSTRPALALPVVLADRLDAIEARLDAVEQAVECPWACGRDACPWRCGGAQ